MSDMAGDAGASDQSPANEQPGTSAAPYDEASASPGAGYTGDRSRAWRGYAGPAQRKGPDTPAAASPYDWLPAEPGRPSGEPESTSPLPPAGAEPAARSAARVTGHGPGAPAPAGPPTAPRAAAAAAAEPSPAGALSRHSSPQDAAQPEASPASATSSGRAHELPGTGGYERAGPDPYASSRSLAGQSPYEQTRQRGDDSPGSPAGPGGTFLAAPATVEQQPGAGAAAGLAQRTSGGAAATQPPVTLPPVTRAGSLTPPPSQTPGTARPGGSAAPGAGTMARASTTAEAGIGTTAHARTTDLASTGPLAGTAPQAGATGPQRAAATAAGGGADTRHVAAQSIAVVKGRVEIEDTVVEKIAAIACTEVAGVAGVGGNLARTAEDGPQRAGATPQDATTGVRARRDEQQVWLHVTIVIEYGAVVMEVANAVKANVARAVSHMLGMRVIEVDVTIDDVKRARAD